MGKIRSKRQEPAKTAKKQIVDNKKLQHLNRLIKVLRPKVYITDTSGFKQLVQELTGNTNTCLSPEITAGQDSPVLVFDDQGSPDEQSVGKESSSSVDSLSPGFDHDPDNQQRLNPNYFGVGDMKFIVGNNYGDGSFLEEDYRYYQDQAEGSWVFESEQYYCNCPSNYYDQQEVSLFEFNHDQFSAAEIISSADVFL